MIDCLSWIRSLEALYNLISRSNGTRAIPFFHRLCTNLADGFCESDVSTASVQTALITTLILLPVISRREQRAAFNEELSDLIKSLQNLTKATDIDNTSPAFQVVDNQSNELQAIIACANGLLADVEALNADGASTTVVESPSTAIVPGGHHDNENRDNHKDQDSCPQKMRFEATIQNFCLAPISINRVSSPTLWHRTLIRISDCSVMTSSGS